MTSAPARRDKLLQALAVTVAATGGWRMLLAVLAVAVGYLALKPAPPTSVDLGWDKLNHVAAFAALAFSAQLGYPTSQRTKLAALVAIFAFGGLIEVLQHFVPSRSAQWGDLLADLVGIACGAGLAAWLVRAVSESHHPRPQAAQEHSTRAP
jgi:VanZ family protein